jgi:hypothetical protein
VSTGPCFCCLMTVPVCPLGFWTCMASAGCKFLLPHPGSYGDSSVSTSDSRAASWTELVSSGNPFPLWLLLPERVGTSCSHYSLGNAFLVCSKSSSKCLQPISCLNHPLLKYPEWLLFPERTLIDAVYFKHYFSVYS